MSNNDFEFDNLTAPLHIVKIGAAFLKITADLKAKLIARDRLPDPEIKSIFVEEDWTIFFNQEWLDNTNIVDGMYEAFYEVRRAYQCLQVLYKDKGLIPYYKEDEDKVELWKKELNKIDKKVKVDLSLDIELDAHAFAYYMMKKLFTVEYPIQYTDDHKFINRVNEIDKVLHLKQNSL